MHARSRPQRRQRHTQRRPRIGQYIKLRRHEVDAWIEAQRVSPGELEHLYVRVQGRYR
jgi:hypothetical protein